jgi:DDE superfamily endonuclease
MNLHLTEIAKAVEPGAHAVLLVDQAEWHLSARLLIPANITILALPPKSPELNPVENIWQYMRDNWLSNRIFYPTTILSITAATPGIRSSTALGKSCPSDYASGLMSSDQWDVVEVITYDDVALPAGRLADRLRAEQYRKFRGETWLKDLLTASQVTE